MVDTVEKKQVGRYTSRDWYEMMKPAKRLHRTSEIVAYHKLKRVFLNLKDIEKEDPDQIEIFQFEGQDFELVADQERTTSNT